MSSQSYSEKLRDPRWQRKRLEILQRDDFKCLACGTKSEELHVHHCYYVSKRNPWEYPDESLLTMCKSCHESIDKHNTDPAHRWAYAWEREAAIANKYFLHECRKHNFLCPTWGLMGSIDANNGGRKAPPHDVAVTVMLALDYGVIDDEMLAGIRAKLKLINNANPEVKS